MFPGADTLGLSCRSNFCGFSAPPAVPLAGAPEGVTVTEPAAGDEFTSLQEIRIETIVGPGVHLYVISLSLPQQVADLDRDAIWVAAVKDVEVVKWADGEPLVDGDEAAILELIQGRPLFLSVLRYDRGRLVAASPVVPIAIGTAWKAPGDACDDAGQVPGSCWHPERLQSCSSEGVCEIVCASHRDCSLNAEIAALTAHVCDGPNAQGVRHCLRP